MLSRGTIYRIYAQGEEAVVCMVGRLEDHIADLEARVTRYPQPLISSLSKELTEAKATLARQADELLEVRQQNHQLVRRIRELEREVEHGQSDSPAPGVERDSRNSSLPPSLDLPWKKVPRTRSLRNKSGKHVGGQPGHKGRTLLQVGVPDEVVLHAPDLCASCGAQLDEAAYRRTVRRQVFDISDGRVKVTEHRAEAIRCSSCNTVTRAKFPQGVRAPVQYGTGVLTRAVYLHLYQLIPVHRTSETMRDLFGCALSPATVERAGKICSGKLVRCEQRIKAAIRDSAVAGADETGLRVAGGSGWVHVARTETHTHYGYDERRGKAAMDEIGILPGFRGTLVRDGFSSYKWYEQCRHSLCNAHLLRELVYIEEVDPEQRLWIEPFREFLFRAKDAAAESKSPQRNEVDSEKQKTILERYEEIIRRADELNPQLPAKSLGPGPVAKKAETGPTPRRIINRLRKRRDEVLRFMMDLSVPFDNNGSERDLRMVKLIQKISGCFRTADGARLFCRIRGYLSTARKQGYPLLFSIERVFGGKPLPVTT